jgi:hypothetical protein
VQALADGSGVTTSVVIELVSRLAKLRIVELHQAEPGT